MPKTPSDKLFQLVKSLSSAEKRYFRVFTNSLSSSSSKYMTLFEAIEAQEHFDDEALRKAVYGDEPIASRKFSELKSYLYQLLVKCLVSYDEQSSIDYKLKSLLLGVRSLFRRSFFEDCKELLAKARKLAEAYEHFPSLIEIAEWEKRIAYAQTDIAGLDRILNRLIQEEQSWAEQLADLIAYRNLFFQFLLSVRKDISRSPAQIEQLRTLMQHPLMASPQQATSWQAQVMRLRIESIYYYSLTDWKAFYEASKRLVELLESNPRMLGEDVSEYISALNNHIISCGRLRRFEEVKQTLEKLRSVKPLTRDDEAKIHRQYYQNKFRLCINSGDFEEGLHALEAHLREVQKFDPFQFHKGNFYLQYFCIYFGAGRYEKALDALNDWLKLEGTVERRDLQSLARILNLIIHYELGNDLLLNSLLDSTRRYLRREQRLSEFEAGIMAFIRLLQRPIHKEEKLRALEALQQSFEKLSPAERGVFELFDVMAWIESKATGKSFAEVVKRHFQQSLQDGA